jgi:anti-sigma28 factor (negative regulator of flagellin synthesis)
MKITPKTAEIVRPEAARAAEKLAAVKASTTGTPADAPKGEAKSDRVQISDAGRALSAQGSEGLSADRLAQIRGRVQAGAYNSLAIVDEVARRILEARDA